MSQQAPDASNSNGAWHVRSEHLITVIEERRVNVPSGVWSYEALGERLGVSGAAISNICRGKTRQPSPRLLRELADVLGVPVEAFVHGRLPADIDWLAPDILEGLRRLEDPGRRDEITRCLRNLLWLGANDHTHRDADEPR